MNQYNPHIHHRRSIRLKGYDYSQAGLYFITICVQNKACLFGEIAKKILCDRPNESTTPDNIIKLNAAGKMVERWYFALESKYPDKRYHEMIIMPNHFHCIIENISAIDTHVSSMDAHVGTSQRGRSKNVEPQNVNFQQNNVDPQNNDSSYGINNNKFNATIGEAMGWFKTMTTNEYIRGVKTMGWHPFNGRLWQRNYWEHIIRDEQSYQRISDYIIDNPAKWQADKFYKN